jgi:hypothetical protein
MRPAVVPVRLSADTAPFAISLGQRGSLAQDELRDLLRPYARLGEHRRNRSSGYRCRHGELDITGSSPPQRVRRIRGRV